MKKNAVIILLIGLILAQIAIIAYSYINDDKAVVKDDYIAVFKSESGESVNATYLYVTKKKNKKKKYTYINTKSTYSGYDSTNWTEKITKTGTLKKRKKIFEIAKKNNAYSYVRYEDGKIYSIEEFKKMFK